MRTATTHAYTLGAGALLVVLAAAPSLAADIEQLEADYDAVQCDVMTMPGSPTATYLDEAVHGPFLRDGNTWIALTLSTEDGDTEVSMPRYGDVYAGSDGGVITEITLCQGTPSEGGGADPAQESDPEQASEDPADEGAAEESAAATEDDAADTAAADDEGEDDPTGPVVETDVPARTAGPSATLIGGGTLAVAGAALAGYAALRRRDGQHTG